MAQGSATLMCGRTRVPVRRLSPLRGLPLFLPVTHHCARAAGARCWWAKFFASRCAGTRARSHSSGRFLFG
jgi:hypothetical protein